jgi:hypothetical protein
MIRAFPLHQARRDLPKLNLDGFEQPFASAFVALTPERKPSCDLRRIRHAAPKGGLGK